MADKDSQSNKDDYYNTDIPKNLLETRNTYIQERREQLQGFYLKHTDEIIKYLLYVNAGGAVAILTFMGTSKSIRNSIYLQIALLCYALALACVGLLRVLLLHKVAYLFENWRKDAEKYWVQDIGYNKLIEEDDKRSESGRKLWIAGYLSAGLSILGLILGAMGLFTQGWQARPCEKMADHSTVEHRVTTRSSEQMADRSTGEHWSEKSEYPISNKECPMMK